MAKSRSGITQFDLDTRMAELMNINPLIDAGGDTYKVQSVIRTLRALIDKAGVENGGSADAWLSQQTAYDLWQAREAGLPTVQRARVEALQA